MTNEEAEKMFMSAPQIPESVKQEVREGKKHFDFVEIDVAANEETFIASVAMLAVRMKHAGAPIELTARIVAHSVRAYVQSKGLPETMETLERFSEKITDAAIMFDGAGESVN